METKLGIMYWFVEFKREPLETKIEKRPTGLNGAQCHGLKELIQLLTLPAPLHRVIVELVNPFPNPPQLPATSAPCEFLEPPQKNKLKRAVSSMS